MKYRLLAFTCSVFFAAIALASTECEYLWPEGRMPNAQPHQVGATTAETGMTGFKADDFRRPYLDWFDPPAAAGKTDICMILISGGGYYSCCDVSLVERWRKKLTAMGVTCVSLTYRTPRPKGLPIHQSACSPWVQSP